MTTVEASALLRPGSVRVRRARKGLGTDTAGSGRVPAAFNGLVGMKPTRGIVSTRGLLPACRSLDCVTTLTRTVAEAREALAVLAADDPDPWSRPVPAQLPVQVAATARVVAIPDGPLDLDPEHQRAWDRAVAHLATVVPHVVRVDISAFLAAARLLYEGPWVAERYAAFGHLLEPDGPHLDPVVRRIVLSGRELLAADAFRGIDRLAALRRATEPLWLDVDALLLPVTPGHPTHAEVDADPFGVNARLGTYTNFVNLLDLSAVAVPAGSRDDGLPFGVQLIAPAFADGRCSTSPRRGAASRSPEPRPRPAGPWSRWSGRICPACRSTRSSSGSGGGCRTGTALPRRTGCCGWLVTAFRGRRWSVAARVRSRSRCGSCRRTGSGNSPTRFLRRSASVGCACRPAPRCSASSAPREASTAPATSARRAGGDNIWRSRRDGRPRGRPPQRQDVLTLRVRDSAGARSSIQRVRPCRTPARSALRHGLRRDSHGPVEPDLQGLLVGRR